MFRRPPPHYNRYAAQTGIDRFDLQSWLVLNVFLQNIRRRKTIGRTIKSLRPSNRTNPNPPTPNADDILSSMPVTDLLPSLTDNRDDDDVFSTEFSLSGEAELVGVDVSGSGYARQTRLCVSSTPCCGVPPLLAATAALNDDDSDVAAEHRRLSSWRKTVCDAGDVSRTVKPRGRPLTVFSAVDVDRSTLFRALTIKKSTSSRRSLVYADGRSSGRVTSTLQVYAAARRGKVLTPGCDGVGEVLWRPRAADSRTSTSWRQSLKSLLKGVVRTKSSVDLWATTAAQHQHQAGETTTGARAINFRRANSLPRSLKAMKRHSSTADAADATSTRSKSKSVDRQLDSTERSSPVRSFRPEVTSAGARLGRSVSLSRSQYQVHGAKSRLGLRPQSMEVQIVAVDEFGRPSSAASGGVTERRVHVNIPEQPWTKPFANVRLRQRTARVIDSDKYQSSSGTARQLTSLCYAIFYLVLSIIDSC